MADYKKLKIVKKKTITAEGIGDIIPGGKEERKNYSNTLHRKKC